MTVDDVLVADAAPRSRPWQPAVAEVLASLVATGAMVLIPLHYVGVHLTFFGAPVVIREEDVRTYWLLVGVLALGVVASFGAARWRRARASFAWHAVVAGVGVLAALAFSVTEAGPAQEWPGPLWPERSAPSEPPHPSFACHSGGSSDECVGG